MPTKKIDSAKNSAVVIDFARLYDNHVEYSARRVTGSFEQECITIEVEKFKIPNLVRLLPKGLALQRIIEIGCATGELIAAFPIEPNGQRVGVDISESNILSACERFPNVEFYAGDFTTLSLSEFDCVILSDILEHVEDDARFLFKASLLGKYVIVNLPLEDNWMNRNRNYGINDESGHLRNYSLEQGLSLFKHAGLHIIDYHRIWAHETIVLEACRQLRLHHFGTEYNGGFGMRILKRAVMQLACRLPSLGRRLFSSNLFVIAQKSTTK